jgi:hypothetical protein
MLTPTERLQLIVIWAEAPTLSYDERHTLTRIAQEARAAIKDMTDPARVLAQASDAIQMHPYTDFRGLTEILQSEFAPIQDSPEHLDTQPDGTGYSSEEKI